MHFNIILFQDCMYLHKIAEPEASFTKEDMHAGKHTEYERLLHEQLAARTEAQKKGLNGEKPADPKKSDTDTVEPSESDSSESDQNRASVELVSDPSGATNNLVEDLHHEIRTVDDIPLPTFVGLNRQQSGGAPSPVLNQANVSKMPLRLLKIIMG